MARFWKLRRVGLALGSGGARGWAHLGVLQALREKGIAVECVAGTSMGAVVGAFLAARREEVLRELAQDLDWKRLRPFFWEVSLSRSGLTDGRRLWKNSGRCLDCGNSGSWICRSAPWRRIWTRAGKSC
jgi:NTE family protein